MSAFSAALERGVIAFQRCASCGSPHLPARTRCATCGSIELVWEDAKGEGTVWALTVVHRAPSEALRLEAPYLIVLVDLDAGPRLMGRGRPALSIGDRVAATITRAASGPIVMFSSIKESPVP